MSRDRGARERLAERLAAAEALTAEPNWAIYHDSTHGTRLIPNAEAAATVIESSSHATPDHARELEAG